jgi:hypothetical protein
MGLNLQVSCIVQCMAYKSVCMNLLLVSSGGELFCSHWAAEEIEFPDLSDKQCIHMP